MRPKLEPANDEPLCRRRHEDKWLVAPGIASQLESRIAAALPLVRHAGLEESRIASIYLDREDQALTELAIRSPDDCTKVRLRAYQAAPGAGGELLFEIKQRRRGVSSKWRLRVEPTDVTRLCEGDFEPGLLQAPLHALLHQRRLLPVVTVVYVRRVYQRDEHMRVTIDRDVRWSLPPRDLLTAIEQVASGSLLESGRLEQVVVELKQSGGRVPRAIRDALTVDSRELGFSKFVAALQSRG